MSTESTTFAKRLKSRRKQLGLTQEQLAGALGFSSKQNISNFEAKKKEREPDYKTLVKLADILRCTTDYLLGKDQEPTRAETDIEKATGLSSEAIAALISYRQAAVGETIQSFLSDLISSSFLRDLSQWYETWIFETEYEYKFQSDMERLIKLEGGVSPEMVTKVNENYGKDQVFPLAVEGYRYCLTRSFENFLTETEQKKIKEV